MWMGKCYRNFIRNNMRNYIRNNTNDFLGYCSDRKSSGHFDPLILGWVSATQRTLSGRSSYLFDNLKRKMVVAATTTQTRCLYYSRLSVVCRYVREYFKQKHKRPLVTAVQPTIVARYTHYTPVRWCGSQRPAPRSSGEFRPLKVK